MNMIPMNKKSRLQEFQELYLPQLDQAWAKFLAESPLAKESELHRMVNYHYETGGKRLRAICVLFAVSEWMESAGEDREELIRSIAMPFAIAVEMLHNATLIHDDLQDGDRIRRGKPTVWKKFSSAQAINCGDLLFFEAIRVILSSKMQDDLKLRLLQLVQEKTIAVIEGQGKEFVLKEYLKDLTQPFLQDSLWFKESYMAMVKGKTSALFSLPIVGAAMIAKLPSSEWSHIEKAAEILGMAFQIRDDYIDLWGEKGRTERGSDIAEGKISYPIVELLEVARRSQDHHLKKDTGRLIEILRKDREENQSEEIAWCIAIIENAGVRMATRKSFFSLEDQLLGLLRVQPSRENVWREIFKSISIGMDA